MKELIKYLKYCLVSSILIFITISCDDSKDVIVEYNDNNTIEKLVLTREDSIRQLAVDLNIDFDENMDNVNIILNKILMEKQNLIQKLDSLDARSYKMENLAYEFKKKEDKLEKEMLLKEIASIKRELEKIKSLSGGKIKVDSTSIPEVKVPDITTFENLPAGNYITRLDKYYLISIYIKKDGSIIIGQPRLDSTTVLKGSKNISPRMKKELDAIRKKFTNKN